MNALSQVLSNRMAPLLAGFFGGMIAWVVIEFICRPVTTFWSLRSKAANVLARYEERVDYKIPSRDYDAQWVAYRQREYVDCGNLLIAYEASNGLVARALHRLPTKWRCSPKKAGENFLILANLRPAEYQAYRTRNIIVAALRLGFSRNQA
jgi:hypothetical protein